MANFVGSEVGAHVEERGFHHGETLKAPIEVGDFFDEAEFGFGGGVELGDEGAADFVVLLKGFGFEDGMFIGSHPVANAVAGGAGFTFLSYGSLGFRAVDAGLFGFLSLLVRRRRPVSEVSWWWSPFCGGSWSDLRIYLRVGKSDWVEGGLEV